MLIQHWDEALSASETDTFVWGLAHLFASRITDSRLRTSLIDFIDARDFVSLCEFRLPYASLHVGDVAAASQVLALYQKRQDLDLGVDKAAVARKAFDESERRCRDTNELFRLWASGKVMFSPGVERVLFRAQRKIAQCLGDVPDVSQLRPRFGPGATTQVLKQEASARIKLSTRLACSEDFAGYAQAYLEEVPLWVGLTQDGPDSVTCDLEIHPGRLSFVPKNAKTDRSIVVEPSLNSFFQLGIGEYLKNRLRRSGVDITDQSINQNLARIGSIDGGLATLDLSSASDSIAIELVAHLLPIDWFLLLSQLRTGTVECKGVTTKLAKFSSMGNGFTFPLETLIFWALAKASTSDETQGLVSVYGDDIIVPVSAVDTLTQALTACGFLLNKEKSFWSGPFRESCGKDYFSGILVRPAFLKGRPTGESLFILHNFFARLFDSEAADYVRNALSPDIQIFGPDGYGDGHLLGGPTVSLYRDHVRKKDPDCQWCGYIFDTFTWRGRKSFRPLPGDYVYPAYTTYLKETAPNPFSSELLDILVKCGRTQFVRLFGRAAFEDCIDRLRNLSVDSTPHRKGGFGVTLPGTRGYKRISIYTLTI